MAFEKGTVGLLGVREDTGRTTNRIRGSRRIWEPAAQRAASTGQSLYVHLCSGEVIQLKPATSVRMTPDSVIALNQEEMAGSFRRSCVYFVADEPMEPPSLQ